MKSRIVMLFAAMLFAGVSFGQKTNFGIKAGLNLANIHNSNDQQYDMKTGFHAGLLAHVHLAPQMALQPEVSFSTQGAKYNAGGVESELKLSYINVPVLFQYMFSNGFRLEAGPQVGFLVNGEFETGSVSADIKDDLNTVDFGIGAGLGFITKSGFGIDARYNLGLTDINKNSPVTSKNRVGQIGLFYQFSHK